MGPRARRLPLLLAVVPVVAISFLLLSAGVAAAADKNSRGATAAGGGIAASVADDGRPYGTSTASSGTVDPGALAAATAAVAALARADSTGAVRESLLRALGGGLSGGPAAVVAASTGPAPAAALEPATRATLHAGPAAAHQTARSLMAAAEATPASAAAHPALGAAAGWKAPKYHLGTRVLSEFLGMMFTIFVGESALANELLPSTKGHGYGFFPVVWSFGFTFYIWLQAFGGVSAKLNPSMCLAQWIAGIITGVDFVCLSLGEIAGAFCGGILVWIMYMPHFKSLPEPPSLAPEDELLRRRDVMQQNALQIASYNTRPEREVGWGRKAGGAAAEATAVAAAAAEKTVHGKGSPELVPPHAVLAGAPSLKDGLGAAAGATPPATTPGRRAAAAGAIMGAFDNFVYYLKPGVLAPRLEDEFAAVEGRDADPWRDEEAAALGGGGAAAAPKTVAVTAHELAERYYAHDDQIERRRRENVQEAASSLSNSRAHSASQLSAGGSGRGGAEAAAAGATGAAKSPPSPPAPLPPLPPPKDLSRRTVQVADLQRHLAELHVAEVRRRVALARGGTIPARPPLPRPSSSPPADAANATAGDDGGQNKGDKANKNNSTKANSKDNKGKHGRPHSHPHLPHLLHALPALPALPAHVDPTPNKPPLDPAREAYARECEAAWLLLSEEERRAHRLYEAALKADQNAKLSIFCTRPAIYSPAWNVIAEAMGTFMLILGALLIELVPDVFLPPELRPLYVRGLQAFLIGIMVVVFISSLGGPTGYAANPARDFGPRLAHFVLPICNKGVSEWRSYGWVPVAGPLIGGAVAGAAYHALRALFWFQL